MKNSRLGLLFAFLLTLPVGVGCNSTRGRQVSLSNEQVPERASSGDGVIATVNSIGDSQGRQFHPIGAARPAAAKPSSWPKLLSPFQSKKKRIPLPLSKPDKNRPDLEVGIDEF